MDLFSFIVAVLVIMVASQYGLYWLMLLVTGIVAFMSKEKKVFFILFGLTALFFLIRGSSFESYSIYLATVAILIYLLLDYNSGEGGSAGAMDDQYGDLLKGLGA